MDSDEFVRKWAASTQSERATAQEHFINLCGLIHEPTPNEADPNGDFYAFEKGAKRPDGDGFADVWLKGHFAWEYKGKHKDLGIAYKQVQTYREALGNPPLLVVSDIERFEVHTNWTNTETWIYHFRNADIALDEPVEVTTYGGPAADAPKLTGSKIRALYEDDEDGLRWIDAPEAGKPLANRSLWADITNDFYFTVLALSAGGLLCWIRRPRSAVTLPLILVLLFTLGQLFFFAVTRFHFPMLPSFCLLAAVGLVVGTEYLQSRFRLSRVV
jgi:hypothetical protein